MPEGKSVYDVYLGAGKAAGEYQASLYEVEDVWSGIESSREMAKWKQEQADRTIDTISAGLELATEIYGGYKAEQEFKTSLGDVSMAKLGERGAYEKVGTKGKAWGEMSMWEKMWDEPKYKFGEQIIGREDITIMARMAKYGIDIEPGPGGKSKVVESTVSKKEVKKKKEVKPVDVPVVKPVIEEEKSMLQEASADPEDITKPGEARTNVLLGMGKEFQQWDWTGPHVSWPSEAHKSKVKDFMIKLQKLGYDVGNIEEDWKKSGILAWGEKSRAAYTKAYKEWKGFQ